MISFAMIDREILRWFVIVPKVDKAGDGRHLKLTSL